MKKTLLLLGLTAVYALTASAADLKVSVTKPGTIEAQVNQERTFYMTVRNTGTENIESITWSVQYGETEPVTVTTEATLPVPRGMYYAFPITAPALSEAKTYSVQVTVTEINGTAYAGTAQEGYIKVYEFAPRLNALVEDYTGSWCGYCPQGYVVMARLAESYPEETLLMAYHYADPMHISSLHTPSSVSGYPTVMVNRGSLSLTSNSVTTILSKTNQCAEALVTVADAKWTDDTHSDISAKVNVQFGEDVAEGDYYLQLFLICSGLTGINENGEPPVDWLQCTYYADSTPGWVDPLWTPFTDGPFTVVGSGSNAHYYVNDVVYDDVCISSQLRDRSGYVGTIPATAAYENATVEYTFTGVNEIKENTTYISDTEWVARPIIQDVSKVKIGAVLLKGSGYINSAVGHVAEPSGVKTIATDFDNNAPKDYYNLQGVKMNASSLTPGIYIVRQGNKVRKEIVR